MSNQRNTVLYIGITNSLSRRTIEHRWKLNKNSFTSKYNVNKLLYFEEYTSTVEAIRREKQLKGWKRCRKEEIIKKMNPELRDLFDD